MRRRPFLWATLAASLMAPAQVAADDRLLEALIAQADALALHEQRAWHTVMHYERGLFGLRSSVDSDWYFLAANGRRDPRAELHATLRAFVEGAEIAPREEKAACAMASRWRMLDEALDFAAQGLAEPVCERRDEWLATLNPTRAWLVFPDAYLNSPASMFGHTLLRIDGTDGSDDSPLLAYAVNFAAQTEETNGLVFAFKGLTGGYVGSFAVLPYYEKVREYSRIENRDLWEYPLQLDEAQLHHVMMHLWQLRGADFDYYFFTKNCSLQLLALLEAAMPERDLQRGFEWWAVPTDTIRALERQDLIGAPLFRPAMSTTMHARAEQVGADGTRLAVDIGRGRLAADALPLDEDPQQAARVLDLAHDWIYYHRGSGKRRDAALANARQVLAARAATGTRSGFEPPEPPEAQPTDGHNTALIGVGGFATTGGSGVLLRLRPVYHDLLDPPVGYGAGSQINFGDLRLAWNAERDRLQLEAFDAVDIISLAPRSTMVRPISWRVGFGARRLRELDSRLGGYVAGGPGLAVRRGSFGAHLFVTAAVDGNRDLERSWSFGGGGIAGLLWQPGARLSALMEIDSRNRLAGGDFDRHEARLGVQWHVAQHWGLRAEGFAADVPGDTLRGVRLTLMRYTGPRFGS